MYYPVYLEHHEPARDSVRPAYAHTGYRNNRRIAAVRRAASPRLYTRHCSEVETGESWLSRSERSWCAFHRLRILDGNRWPPLHSSKARSASRRLTPARD